MMEKLKRLANEGLGRRLDGVEESMRQRYHERLAHELSAVERKGVASYFLTLEEIVSFARASDILVGPGRGSAPGSLLLYVLGVTEVDPIAHGLLFERFFDPSQQPFPDVDLDFEERGRGRIVDHVRKVHGEDCVAGLVSFGRSREGAVVTRPHASGLLISPVPLAGLVPLFTGRDGLPLVEYDFDACERLGLLRFDFVGLETLDLTHAAETAINRRSPRATPFSVADVPLDDPLTFRLLGMGLTTGVFQFESQGARELLVKLRPESFDDLVALDALHRAAPLECGYVDLFLDRRRSRQAVEYPHPVLRSILEPTFGLPIYQEQIMAIAVEFAGYPPSETNQLRRDIGKKRADTLQQQEERFVAGAVAKHGVSADLAGRVFTDLLRHGGFASCKAHSVAYTLLTYRTAWLKAHLPRELFDALATLSPRFCADDPSWPLIARYAMECAQLQRGEAPGTGDAEEPPF